MRLVVLLFLMGCRGLVVAQPNVVGPAETPAHSVAEAIDACAAAKIRHMGQQRLLSRARVHYPGDSTIDVTYYGLALALTHTPAYLRGAATVSLRSAVSSLRQFSLDLTDTLRVDSVRAGGQRLPFTHRNNQLTITPIRPLIRNESLTFVVFYQGRPSGSRGFGSFVFSRQNPGNPASPPVIWSLSQPYGARDWFPCKDTPGDKADSSAVQVTAPAEFVSISNGALAGIDTNANGTRTYRWRNGYPIAPYLISVAASPYVRYDTPFASGSTTLPVTHYLYPGSLAANRPNLDQTPAMLRIFSDRFGPYPFAREKYGHAEFGWGGGMEHQTISSMGGFSLGLIAHELAHQWFGDKITCRDWSHIWLNEGFASYAEALYVEAANGPAAYQTYMQRFMERARNATGTLYVPDVSNVTNIFNGNRTYAKGATVLHMLRGVVGDSTFFRILRTYASSSVAYGTAVTEDFQRVAEEVTGQNLGYFFRQWIYGEDFPTYAITPNGLGTNVVTLRIAQSTTSANPAFFTMPIQVQLTTSAGDSLVTVFNDRADQTFTLRASRPIINVVVDPTNRILKNVVLNLVTAAEPATTFRAFPNPATDQVTVEFSAQATGSAVLHLTTLAGRRVRTVSLPNVVATTTYQQAVSVAGLPGGLYVVTLQEGGRVRSLRIVIH